ECLAVQRGKVAVADSATPRAWNAILPCGSRRRGKRPGRRNRCRRNEGGGLEVCAVWRLTGRGHPTRLRKGGRTGPLRDGAICRRERCCECKKLSSGPNVVSVLSVEFS